jgi:uncharacterized membrane protein
MATVLERFHWWKVALLVSLALNVFLLAYAGGLWAGNREPAFLRLDPQRPIERLASRLPAPDATLLREAYHSREGAIAAVRKEHAEAVERVLDLMAQSRLDAQALREAAAAVREHRRRMDDLVADALLTAIEKMPVETRVQLAKPPKRRATP